MKFSKQALITSAWGMWLENMSEMTMLHIITNRWKYFLRKPQVHCSSVVTVFPTAVLWNSAFPTLLCYLFTYNGMGKMDGRYNLARLWFALPSNTALQLGQEDLFRSNSRHMDSCLWVHYSAFTLWLMLTIIILRTTALLISKTIGLVCFMKQHPPACYPSTW